MNQRSGISVDQIDHVEMFVPDRREAADWYERMFGLRVVSEYEHWSSNARGPLMISSDGGSTKLALFQGESPGESASSRDTIGFHLVAFRVGAHDFLSFVDRVQTFSLIDHLGRAVIAENVVDHGKSFSLYFCDPYGHRLELTTYDADAVREAIAGAD